MEKVKVSSKYQVVIPQKVREHLHLKSGETLQVFAFDDRIEMIRVRDIRSAKGIFKGMKYNPDDIRDESDR